MVEMSIILAPGHHISLNKIAMGPEPRNNPHVIDKGKFCLFRSPSDRK